MVKRIDRLTDEQAAQMAPWAAKWIEIGLSTEPMDLARFEPAARASYRYAELEEPRVVVPVSSPLALALAAPIAARIIEETERRDPIRFGPPVLLVRDAVEDAVGDAVVGAVGGAVRD